MISGGKLMICFFRVLARAIRIYLNGIKGLAHKKVGLPHEKKNDNGFGLKKSIISLNWFLSSFSYKKYTFYKSIFSSW